MGMDFESISSMDSVQSTPPKASGDPTDLRPLYDQCQGPRVKPRPSGPRLAFTAAPAVRRIAKSWIAKTCDHQVKHAKTCSGEKKSKKSTDVLSLPLDDDSWEGVQQLAAQYLSWDESGIKWRPEVLKSAYTKRGTVVL